ncbi:MAG TPA: phosphatase PAP2 family protein [Mycobacteriales bacterium]|nr:phosphatase PAP2 family protein [Mycobacteriales bacterium]
MATPVRVATDWRLIARPLIAPITVLAIGGAVVAAVLGHHYAGTDFPGRLDTAVDGRVAFHLADHPRLMDRLVQLGAPRTVVLVALALAVVCVVARRFRAAAFAVIAPIGASALTELVLKPLVDRHKQTGLAFPSGHTTGAFSLALTAAVLLLPHRPDLRMRLGFVRLVLGAGVVALAAGTAIALVALHYHYATDTLGGAAVALAVVPAVALTLDLLRSRGLPASR